MRPSLLAVSCLVLSVALAAACGKKDEEGDPIDTDTEAETETETETDTPSDTETDTPSDTETDTPSDTETEAVCPGGCLIDAVCHADGDVAGDNPCLHCDAAMSAIAWSDNDGATCDDGVYCNGVDACEAGACTAHAGDPCGDDGLFCDGADSCDEDADTCAHSGDPCVAWGEACFEAGDTCTACRVLVNGGLADYADHDGSSWELAFATVQEGLDAAGALVETTFFRCQVWVAAGTYVPTADGTGAADPLDPRTRTLHVPEGVGLYGGFAGTEDHLAERDAAANETVLSGDLTSPADPEDDPSDNAYHVLATSESNVVDGFTIRGGFADHWIWPHYAGAGLLAEGGSASIVGCTFDGNTADAFMGEGSAGLGGGVYAEGGALEIASCSFTANAAYDAGGALYAYDAGLSVADTSFQSNSAEYGGAVYLYALSDPLSMTDCTFESNDADEYGGGAYIEATTGAVTGCAFEGNGAYYGGGLYLYDNAAEIAGCGFDANDAVYGGGIYLEYDNSVISSTLLSNNTAEYGGGLCANGSEGDYEPEGKALEGITITGNSAMEGGGIYSAGSMIELVDASIPFNTAEFGGGVYAVDDDLSLTGCSISGNEATSDGGGVLLGGGGQPAIVRCTLDGNTADGNGGAVLMVDYVNPAVESSVFSANVAGGQGGAIWSSAGYGEGDWPVVWNGTFVDNDSGVEAGGDAVFSSGYSLELRNCVLWGSLEQIGTDWGTIDVSYSDVQGGYDGVGNIDADPLFVSATDFHLEEGSPLIDAGEGCNAPILDRDSGDRRDIAAVDNTGAGPAVDIGAYEAQGGVDDGPAAGWVSSCCDVIPPMAEGEPAYAYCRERLDHAAAEARCEADGLHLAAITSPEENAYLQPYVQYEYDPIFLGATDAAYEGTWEWVTGEPWSFTTWAGGEPNDWAGDEDCLQIYASGAWNDGSCLSQIPFLCEGTIDALPPDPVKH